MADERTITIRLVTSNSVSKSDSFSNEEDNGNKNLTNTLNQALHPVRTLEKSVIGKNLIVYQGFNYAKAAIKNSVMYSINRTISLREDYFAEQSFNNAMNIIGKVGSLAASIGSGAIGGSMFGGPIGAAVGAAVGVVGFVANEAISGWQKFDQQDMKIAEMNYGSSFSLERMGLTNGGRGTEN